ncbi:MAG: thioredoxin domain-containing protein [Solirubrobacterales bacterium]|nr:thioredoxin domain-containing protein [Solirubrobacterales bacterium]
MSNLTPQPTKKERKEAAREARLAKEREEATAAARRRRLFQLGAVLLGAVAIVAVAIALSSGGGDDGGSSGGGEVAGAKETTEMLAGIPQDGITLGKADAPVTLVEFADPQCPFCKEYAMNAVPPLVEKYVRTGKVKMQLQVLTFVGADSKKAGQALAGAAQQDKLWNAAHLVYFNQGQENTGYVTDEWINGILGAIPGLDVDKALSDASGAPAAKELQTADAAAQKNGIMSTPSFLLGPTGGTLKKVELQELTSDAMSKEIDKALASAQS